MRAGMRASTLTITKELQVIKSTRRKHANLRYKILTFLNKLSTLHTLLLKGSTRSTYTYTDLC